MQYKVKILIFFLFFIFLDFNKSGSYFLRISRLREAGQNDVCYRTELTKSNNRVLHWKCVKLNIQPLCNGDVYRPLIMELFQFGSNGTHSLVGSITTSLNKMQSIQAVQMKAPNLYIFLSSNFLLFFKIELNYLIHYNSSVVLSNPNIHS